MYSPVASHENWLILLEIEMVAAHNCRLGGGDVKIAYLYAKMDFSVVMELYADSSEITLKSLHVAKLLMLMSVTRETRGI